VNDEYENRLNGMTWDELEAEADRIMAEIREAEARIAWCDRVRGGGA